MNSLVVTGVVAVVVVVVDTDVRLWMRLMVSHHCERHFTSQLEDEVIKAKDSRYFELLAASQSLNEVGSLEKLAHSIQVVAGSSEPSALVLH